MNFSGRHVVGEEGRVAARHGRRPSRPWASTPSSCATARPACPAQVARWVDAAVINAGDGWHEHPTQALLDCYTIRQHLGVARRACASPSSATSSTAGWPAPTSLAFTALGAEVTLVAPADAAAAEPRRAGRCTVSHDLDAVLPDGRRRLPAAHAARAHDRGAGADAAGVHAPATASPAAGPTCSATTRSSCTPGPMNRGVEIAAEVADLPRVGDHRPGPQRRRRAHGRPVPAARHRAADRPCLTDPSSRREPTRADAS